MSQTPTVEPTSADPEYADASEVEEVPGSGRPPVGIRLDRVSKRFRGGVLAVSDVDLTVEPGEFMVLVGPSGCGKSTLLRMIGGLEDVTSGRVLIGDKDV